MSKYQKMLLSEKMAENITDLIAKGYYKPGDKLPNEIEISSELGVSRATLREAFKILESRNVIEVKRGIGTFIAMMPGLSKDPLGKQFLPYDNNYSDYIHHLQYIGTVLIDKYTYFNKYQQDKILASLQSNPEDTQAVFKAIFKLMQGISVMSESEFLRRMLVLLVRLYKDEMMQITVPETVVKDYYRYMCDALRLNDQVALDAAYKGLIESLKEKE